VGGGWLGEGGFGGVRAEAGNEFFLRTAETIYWGVSFYCSTDTPFEKKPTAPFEKGVGYLEMSP
jgi:hypothetical protein